METDPVTGEVTKRGREIHFVLESSQIKAIRKLKDATLRPMRIFIEGQAFNVRFLDVHIHHSKKYSILSHTVYLKVLELF